MNRQTISFDGMSPFWIRTAYADIDSKSSLNTHQSHIHEECEIYINVSGDVSFAVEGSVYPLVSGNAILTRPGEYHHCIYHSEKPHRHFWILFSSGGNEPLLDLFFQRPLGKNNLISFTPDQSKELFSVCFQLAGLADSCAGEDMGAVERYRLFFALLGLLQKGQVLDAPQSRENGSLVRAVNYINGHLGERLSVSLLAQKCNTSVTTLERQFAQSLNITPTGYIQKKRLAHGARLLAQGESVTEAAAKSGFSDTSCFISRFKAAYKITPLQYKKSAAAPR